MLWIIQTIVFSILFIAIIHYLYLFFMNNLTIPIVKDLVHTPSNQYKNIFNIINSSNNTPIHNINNINNNNDNNNNNNNDNNDNNDNIHNDNIHNNSDFKYSISDLVPNSSNRFVSNSSDRFVSNSSLNMKNELKSFLLEQLND